MQRAVGAYARLWHCRPRLPPRAAGHRFFVAAGPRSPWMGLPRAGAALRPPSLAFSAGPEKKEQPQPQQAPPKAVGHFGRVKALIKEYGAPFAVWYGTLYFGFGLGIYGTLVSGVVVDQNNIHELFEYVNLDALAEQYDLGHVLNEQTSVALAALALNEMCEVVRLPLAIATTPYIIRAVRGPSSSS
uniref:DUF1279 domain-containing protein n=1 Tax=Phaeomonas parva TaxID=124430 RepID=A0A7S1UAG9_9STRA